MKDDTNQANLIAHEGQIVQFQVKRVIVPIQKYDNNWRELAQSQKAEPMEARKGPYYFIDLWKNLSCILTAFSRITAEAAFKSLVFHRLTFDKESGELCMAILSSDGKLCAIGILSYKVVPL